MNLLAMRAKLRTRLGVPDTDALYTDDQCTSLLNSALHQLEGEAEWAWLEQEATVTTADGDYDYALPAGYRSTITVTNPDGFELHRATAAEALLLRGASGVPKVYDVLNGQLRLAPTPDSVLDHKHVYIGGEDDLADDADEPTLPTVWHDLVVEYAAALGFRRWGTAADAGAALAAYQKGLESMLRVAPRYSKDLGGGDTPAPPAAP